LDRLPVEAAAEVLRVSPPAYAKLLGKGLPFGSRTEGCAELDVVRAAIYRELVDHLGQVPGKAAFLALLKIAELPTGALFVVYAPQSSDVTVARDARALAAATKRAGGSQVVALERLVAEAQRSFRNKVRMRVADRPSGALRSSGPPGKRSRA
jgi:hypothetical protein